MNKEEKELSIGDNDCPSCGQELSGQMVKVYFQLLDIPEIDSLIKLNVFDCPQCNKQIVIRGDKDGKLEEVKSGAVEV